MALAPRARRLLAPLALAALFLLALAPFLSAAPAPAPAAPPAPQLSVTSRQHLDPRLLKPVLTAGDADIFDVIVELRDPSPIPAPRRADEARGRVVAELQAYARSAQAGILAQLDALQAAGHVTRVRSFWIFNGLAVRADRAALLALAARDDVRMIRENAVVAMAPAPAPVVPESVPAAVALSASPWNLVDIRAELARSAFGVDGRGVVVANMSSGVDYLHPALHRQYRGCVQDPCVHNGNWADVTSAGYAVPTDDLGAGTHTMGTLVADGVGVAPGARWIAVKVVSGSGIAIEEWLHAGFQWAMAPGGDPALAPDIVICGWSLSDPTLEMFRPDVAALRAAGIFAVYSTGDTGPAAGSIGAPGSYAESFAAGSYDPEGELANFSGRGPSPWGDLRPDVVAPGVFISSTVPGGRYAMVSSSPTAPPHAGGVAALLLQADPALSPDEIAQVLRATARPLGDPSPNNDAGWGRIDAYAAVASVRAHGTLAGIVTDGTSPLPGAQLNAVRQDGLLQAQAVTGDDGRYALWLAPGTYTVTAGAFTYYTRTLAATVIAQVTSTLDLPLAPLPAGGVRGRLVEAGSAAPVTGTVHVVGTPITVTTDAGGDYAVSLPAGTYALRVRSLGHRPATSAPFDIVPDTVITQDFTLEPSARILFVDAAAWYYGTDGAYFRRALDDLDYVYDVQPVKILPRDVPTAEQLGRYDLVIWSSPFASPGYLGGDNALYDFLADGGDLFLTGQDVGYWDGGLNGYFSALYYTAQLRMRVLQDDVITRTVTGVPGELLQGLTLTLNGPDSADNQFYPDIVLARDLDMGAAVATYTDFGEAASRGNVCVPYRYVYLAFGFEGIRGAADRREVMRRALDWLSTPQPARAVELRSEREPQVARPGSAVTHTVRIRNIGMQPETLALSISGAQWPTTLVSPTLSLGQCRAATRSVHVTIPPAAGWDERDVARLTAAAPGISQSLDLTTKAPAPVLYVDDDRFYTERRVYMGAFAAAGIPYDYWLIGWSYNEPGLGSPPAGVLGMYPIVVWSTGYDWYDPLSQAEESRLADYLRHGGRLLLSSQDDLAVRGLSPFSREWLGVLDFTESLTATQVWGAENSPLAVGDGPFALDYPFLNWSDALVPYDFARPAFYSQDGYPVALTVERNAAKTLFYAFPFEALREPDRAPVMGQSAGWLSALGDTTITADRAIVQPGETVTYTLVVRNDGLLPLAAVQALNALPQQLAYVPGSLSGPGQYDPDRRAITWSGALAPGAAAGISYRARVAPDARSGEAIANPLSVTDEQLVPVARAATVRVGTPDLRGSAARADPPAVRSGTRTTVTLTLRNTGLAAARSATVTTTVPVSLTLVPGSLWISAGRVQIMPGGLVWTGDVTTAAPVTVRFALDGPAAAPIQRSFAVQSVIDDNAGDVFVRPAWMRVGWFEQWLAVVGR